MNVLIKNREQIEELSKAPFSDKVALVSITDYGCDFAELKHKPAYLLQLAFDDVDNDVFEDELGDKFTELEKSIIEEKYHMFTDVHAKQVVDFYFKVCDKVDFFVCQCEHGQSRSAAVAASIIEYRDKKAINIFADDGYYPNKVVFRKILKLLNGGGKFED